MQQDRGGGVSDQDMKQNQQQDRRLKPLTGENQQPQQQQQQQHPPQKKGKRTKTSSSGENSRSQPQIPQQQAQQQNLTTPQSMISSNPMIGASTALRTKESGSLASSAAISSMGSYYPGGGFLSSLAAIQSMNQPQPFNQPRNQALSIGGDLGGSSNLGLLQGYSVPSFGSQQHQPIQQTQFFHMGNREKTGNMYPADQEGLIQSSRPAAGSSQQNWHQSFINSSNPTVSEGGLWSINNNSSSTSTAGNTIPSNTSGASSLNPNQWPDLPGYGAPPYSLQKKKKRLKSRRWNGIRSKMMIKEEIGGRRGGGYCGFQVKQIFGLP
ncbi:hypothetical protein QQP08_020279 [Theobroma cacao]|nr:hypothetical protein QQP08_020279 [Theobroma cacao]